MIDTSAPEAKTPSRGLARPITASGVRAPASRILLLGHLAALLALAVVWAALQMPAAGLRVVPDHDQVALIGPDRRILAVLPTDTILGLAGSTDVVADRAEGFLQDYAPVGDRAAIARWYADRSKLAAMIARGPLQVRYVAGGRLHLQTLTPRPRSLADLSLDVWMLLGGGLAVFVVGVWIWALRPRDWAPRMLALAALGILVTAFSGALFDAKELTADGRLLWTLNALNLVGSNLCAAATVAQFLFFPTPLARPIWLVPAGLAAVAWGLAGGLGWLPASAYYAGLLAHVPVLAALLALQWRRVEQRPLDRGALRWIGLITLCGSGLLVVMMAAPKLLGGPSAASDGFAFVPLIFVYGGMALAVGRYRLFDLDLWAYRIVVGALTALALLALDALLVMALHVEGGAALGVSIVVVALVYLPLRAWVWKRLAGRAAISDDALFELAASVAFKPDAAERRADWTALLRRLFDPLEVSRSDLAPTAPVLLEDGLALVVPAAAGEAATTLRYPAQGRRLFTATDTRLVAQLVLLMGKAEAARDSYARGVLEERERIARDLHDDVSARLLTSLHREDVREVRRDVRDAMADIRVILSGLSGDQVELNQILADLRHETAERLKAAGVTLVWPIAPEGLGNGVERRVLDYALYKTLISALREIVTNTIKHAGATRLSVEVREEAGRLRIVVIDDGRAASDLGRATGGGHGLKNIRFRLERLGGTLAFERADTGARTELVLPL
ncbi:hypothetical protein BH10PSE4_BH10PSE4_26530 [soil metagenome]